MIRFLAELSLRLEVLIQSTPSNGIQRLYNVYELYIGQPPENTYWTDWGGTYDEYTGENIELYFDQFLQRVSSLDDVKAAAFSIFIDGDTVYFNVPKHPWLYASYASEGESVIPFLSSALNPEKPSINYIKGEIARVRLEIPNFNVQLSDSVSGVVKNQDFTLALFNNDGLFDDEGLWNLFNTPVHIKKAVVENPSYEDFKEIRTGYVQNLKTTFKLATITAGDKLRSLEELVCDVIDPARFPSVTLDENAVGKAIPVIYGTKQVKLIALSKDRGIYLAAEYINTLVKVLDKDGNDITATATFNTTNYAITITGQNPDQAVITGYTGSTIGAVIRDLVTRKSNIEYIDSFWNMLETDDYITSSPVINKVLSGGNVKSAIESVLKSDMAFFIQQTDGRFTVRKWGKDYQTHEIKPWILTKEPDKEYLNANTTYFSSCLINYGEGVTHVFNENENAAEDEYRKRKTNTFDTDLVAESDAHALALALSQRYTFLKQTVKLPVGFDTSPIELLDKVYCKLYINGRRFSKSEYWIVKAVNQSQDILTLEEINVLDLSGEYPDTTEYERDYDNMYGDTPDDVFEYIVDGGEVL
jgi:uncharacterized Fe-S cluster protein YjdI